MLVIPLVHPLSAPGWDILISLNYSFLILLSFSSYILLTYFIKRTNLLSQSLKLSQSPLITWKEQSYHSTVPARSLGSGVSRVWYCWYYR